MGWIYWAAVCFGVLAGIQWIRVAVLLRAAQNEPRGGGGLLFAAHYRRRTAYWLTGLAAATWLAWGIWGN